ncbi:MAG: NADH-quinone oxidoreductase subunit L [Mycobacterium leprae]
MKFFADSFWLIAALPLTISALIAAFARQLKEKAWWVGAGGMFVSFLWSLMTLFYVIANPVHGGEEAHLFAQPVLHLTWENWATWGSFKMPMGIMVDNLTAVMLVVVTLVSFAVQMYSAGYMHGERRFTRFYSAINLFTTGMLGLVLADNLFLLLVSWEIMGLCSYLLIGHWYEQDWPKMGSIKAFLTTRVGDVGIMVGIWAIFSVAKTLTWEGLATTIPNLMKTPATAAVVGLGAFLIFTGAIGKSAQFPLHTWLPDAMAGPTPGSALIHAATMVAAGVYLVGRSYMIFANAAPWVLEVVAFIGGFTSLFAASIATLRHDIKEVLAYSTISQLGYMIMALGLGGWAAGNFHLMTHAFFKALLFLAAGSVIMAHHHNQLLHKMGGLRKKIPVTFWTWMVGYLALAGFPGFSGFFSKDELLLAAWTWAPAGMNPFVAKLPFIMALLTAFLTAYYMTRATYLAFFGEPRDKHLYEHAHESPWTMTVPLVILAVPALLAGWVWAALPAEWFHAEGLKFLERFYELAGTRVIPTEQASLVTLMATTAGLTGILIGWLLYAKVAPATRARVIKALNPVYNLIRNKYYVDELYDVTVIKGVQVASVVVAWFDGHVVDGLVNGVGVLGNWIATASDWFDWHVVDRLVTMWADFARALSSAFRRISTGYVQQYMLTFVVVVVASVLLFQVIR